MNAADTSMRLTRSLHFFGRITANLSHEMNNVVTIIGEVSGLLDDLLLLAASGRPLDAEKLKTLSENIKRQTRRGKALITEMNFLGHSIDEASRQIDLNLVASHIESLARRIVERKGGVLEVKPFERPVMAVCSPFDLLQSVFWCIDLALDAGAVSAPICIAAYVGGQEPCVSIRSAGFEQGDRERETLSHIGMLLADSGGTVTSTLDDRGGRMTVLKFPPMSTAADRAS